MVFTLSDLYYNSWGEHGESTYLREVKGVNLGVEEEGLPSVHHLLQEDY